MRDPGPMRWVTAAAFLVACSDDVTHEAPIPARVVDAGAPEAGPVDAGSVKPPPPDIDPPFVPVPNPNWHIEYPSGSPRAWMVSPTGQRQFLLGVDGVLSDVDCNGMTSYANGAARTTEWTRLNGDYGFNAIGAFSALETGATTDPPYSIVLSPVPLADDHALKNASGQVLQTGMSAVKVGDPWNPAFSTDLFAMAKEFVAPRKSDLRLQFYYLGEETGMFDLAGPTGGLRDFRNWLWSDCPTASTVPKPKCVPHALIKFLVSLYPGIADLNTAWGSSYLAFEDVMGATKPIPYTASCNDTCAHDLSKFVQTKLLPQWIFTVTADLQFSDDKHVLASPRLALADSTRWHFGTPADTWADSGQSIGDYDPYAPMSRFQAIALNVYSPDATFEAPWLTDGLAKIHEETQLPIVISETGTRTMVAGWSNQGGSPAFVADQPTRAARWSSQLAQLSAVPNVVGVFFHAWSDRYVEGDATRQLQQGLVQCADPGHAMVAGAAWPGLAPAFHATNVGLHVE